MARRPRPVDPTAGPVQAFAHDLRNLREKAGSPTYRALAHRAGYSAATLSEAARGQRRPSLDVTLAFVGACGGDVDEWRLRWHDLAAETSTEPTRAPDPQSPKASGPPSPPESPAPQRARPRRWPRRRVLVVVAVVLVVLASGLVLVPRIWFPAGSQQAGCPGAEPGAFTGLTYTFTRVRAAAALSAPVSRTVPAGCTVTFAGYCLGDTVMDETSGTPDTRWFILPGGDVMASGVVHGNPPHTLGPSSCAGNVAPPTAIQLTVSQNGTELRLQASGQGIKIVGFTALRTNDSDGPRWRQLAFTAAPAFETHWQPDRSPTAPAPQQSITIAAVACLGGDGPTTVIDARTLQPDDPEHGTPTTLSATALDAATRSACQYPVS
ncbi:helix-turn-helix domain-containing protein [Amycolatopsis pithecellobii]|uniref:helix-turn-helix domain-containing protein n=1 Tax=Amycolatopsis pithecellobii TaxID=664692 RepID=UPI001AA02E6D|nr:helix-turn-helix transcriptional regulator [Amycolatopsis pithecellobii]